ncbi:MAG: hypothetical protein Q4C87_04875 [Actinomycetaceae bacterium]|nr:hypothetical protein [Actinomycetaceae bacterium]
MALMLILLLLPGGLLAWACGTARLDAFLLAPVLSVGLVASTAIIMGALGIPFTLANYFTIALGLSIIIITWRVFHPYLRAIKKDNQPPKFRGIITSFFRSEIQPRKGTWLAVFSGLLVNCGVVFWTFIQPLAGPDSFIQTYDTPFHFSVITYLRDTANGSSIGAALVDRTIGSPFYPAAWHDTVALVSGATEQWLPIIVNVSVIAILAIVWPLSAMALARVLISGRPFVLFATGALAGLFSAFPMRFAIWGILYSNLLSWAILPGAMALFILLFRAQKWQILRASTLFLFAFAGVALSQPNGVFTAVVLLVPFLMGEIWRRCQALPHGKLWGVVANIVFIIALAFGWRTVHYMEFMQRTVLFDWPAHTTLPGAFYEILTGATNDMPREPVMAYATLIAVAVWLYFAITRKDRLAWPAIAVLIGMAMFVIGSGIPSGNVPEATRFSAYRDLLTGFWYHDQYRLAAIPIICALPVVAGVVDDVIRFLVSFFPIRVVGAQQGRRQRQLHTAIGTALVAAIVIPTLALGEFPIRRGNIAHQSSLEEHWPLTASELTFMRKVRETVGTDPVILNVPYDGSAFAYSLVGLNVVYRSYEANWIGKATADQEHLHLVTSKVADSPKAICPLLERNNVEYVLIMDKNRTSWSEPHPILRYNVKWWRGLEITNETPGFTPVMTSGTGDTLYEITACK